MAAIVPTSVVECGVGVYRLLIANFSTASVNDTWTSGIQGVVALWAASALQGTQASAGANVVVTTASTGLLTVRPGVDSVALTLFIISTK